MWLLLMIIALICGIVLYALHRQKDVMVSMCFLRLVEFKIDARDVGPRGEGKRPPDITTAQ